MTNRRSATLAAFGVTVLAACASGGAGGFGDGGETAHDADAAVADATLDVGRDATHAHDASRDVTTDAHLIDAFGDAARDSAVDATREAGSAKEASADAERDGHTSTEAGHDAAHDAERDGRDDVTRDAAKDAEKDTGVDAGPLPTLLFLGASSTVMLAGQLHVGGTWTTSTLAGGGTSFPPALTALSTGTGVGGFTSGSGGTTSAVMATTWTRAGGWQPPAAIAATATSPAQPFLDGTGGTTAHLVYQGNDFHFYYLAYVTAWTTTPVSVGADYGPVPASVAALGANATVGFVDGADTNAVASDDLSAGTWQAKVDLAETATFTVPSAIIPLSAGPQLMMVYVEAVTARLLYVTRSLGVWSAPTAITGALTNNAVALAPLASGAAILAFRGQDSNLYWTLYSGGAWSTVAALQTPNVSVQTSPSITHGIGTDVAEIAFIETTNGAAYSSSLTAGGWTIPTLVGGASLTGVAIAATP